MKYNIGDTIRIKKKWDSHYGSWKGFLKKRLAGREFKIIKSDLLSDYNKDFVSISIPDMPPYSGLIIHVHLIECKL